MQGNVKAASKNIYIVHLTYYILSNVFVHFHGRVSITLKILSEVDFRNTFYFLTLVVNFMVFKKAKKM